MRMLGDTACSFFIALSTFAVFVSPLAPTGEFVSTLPQNKMEREHIYAVFQGAKGFLEHRLYPGSNAPVRSPWPALERRHSDHRHHRGRSDGCASVREKS